MSTNFVTSKSGNSTATAKVLAIQFTDKNNSLAPVTRITNSSGQVVWSKPYQLIINVNTAGITGVVFERADCPDPAVKDGTETITASKGFSAGRYIYYGELIKVTPITASGYAPADNYDEYIKVVGDMSITLSAKSITGSLKSPVRISGGMGDTGYSYEPWLRFKNNNTVKVTAQGAIYRLPAAGYGWVSSTEALESRLVMTSTTFNVAANSEDIISFAGESSFSKNDRLLIAVKFTASGYSDSRYTIWSNYSGITDDTAYTTMELPRHTLSDGYYEYEASTNTYDCVFNINYEYEHSLPYKLKITSPKGVEIVDDTTQHIIWGLPSMNGYIDVEAFDPMGWFREPPSESIDLSDMSEADFSI